jgi:hypothetical protein
MKSKNHAFINKVLFINNLTAFIKVGLRRWKKDVNISPQIWKNIAYFEQKITRYMAVYQCAIARYLYYTPKICHYCVLLLN